MTRLRAWLFHRFVRPHLERALAEINAHLAQRIARAWHEGYAHGERAGAKQAFEAVNEHIRERTGIYESEVIAADVGAARARVLH